MAEVLDELGYVVDVTHKRDRRTKPLRRYDLVVGERLRFDRRHAELARAPVRAYLATSLHHRVHNENVARRYEALAERRGVELERRRVYGEAMPAVETAAAVLAVGNATTAGTWEGASRGPVLAFDNHVLVEPERVPRTLETARRHFLYLASGGQVQKGLDLLLEVFPRHPELHLHVCSGFEREPDFCACYRRELFETPNVHPVGWLDVGGPEWRRLCRLCAWAILPTCSEGQAGSVVQCMAAGLVPVVTREAGIDPAGTAVLLEDDALETIERAVVELSERDPGEVERLGERALDLASTRYTEAAFVDRWRAIVESLTGRAVGE
jgi:glycosyltransferase involved in cell wall biosynthesis